MSVSVWAFVVVTFSQLVVVSIGDGGAASVAQAPVAAPSVLADAEAVSGAMFAQRRDPDAALAIMATLADIYDDTRMSPMWPGSLPSPGSLTPAELVRLLGICSGVALGIYGLLTFDLRRRSPRSRRWEPS
jgi:hypothetical protein